MSVPKHTMRSLEINRLMRLLLDEESGQAFLEYVLVLCFVAIICIGSLQAMGEAAKNPLKLFVENLSKPSHP